MVAFSTEQHPPEDERDGKTEAEKVQFEKRINWY